MGSAWAQKVVKTSPKSTGLGPSLAPTSEKWPSWSASKKRTKNTSEIMLKCLQKGSPNEWSIWGFWLFGVTQMTFSGILRAWFPPRARFWAKLRSNIIKSTKICFVINIYANLTCKMKAASTPNMERQHLKFHALASVCTRLQTSTHPLLGQPSSKANTYKQLSFLDPQLFQSQISNSKAISELATTRHTHTHTQAHQHTHSHTRILT